MTIMTIKLNNCTCSSVPVPVQLLFWSFVIHIIFSTSVVHQKEILGFLMEINYQYRKLISLQIYKFTINYPTCSPRGNKALHLLNETKQSFLDSSSVKVNSFNQNRNTRALCFNFTGSFKTKYINRWQEMNPTSVFQF